MEIVAEVVLSVSLGLLFEKLSSSEVLKFARQEHLHTQLKKWEKKLLEISEVLNDAEEKQIAKKSVKGWLSELRDLAYDMEDVLDEFSYEALRTRIVAQSSSSSKVCKFIPTCCTSIQAIRNVKMGSKIKDINSRLEAIYAEKAELGLDKVAAITHSTSERPLRTSLVYEPWIYGRDADKQKIMDMLLMDDDPIQTNVSVVPIVAMGGMGKTTLARLVYDDLERSNHFNLRAWACVSDQFDAVRVTNTILKEVTSGSSIDSQDLNQIQVKLKEALQGKKFLLVLDDIWNDKYDDWDCLRSPFQSGAPGSKILITTRNKKVAMMMRGDKNFYELRQLSDDDCWSVFKKHAFENRNVDEHPNLVSIGRKIVKKCGGLPLAARALGGLLRSEEREDRWNIILSNQIWDLPEDECNVLPKCNIIPALILSYNHLPSHLKRCFSYCAIFPQDFEFDKEELIRLWIAEGFIQQLESHRQKIELEDLGDDYFQELLSRSFFLTSSTKKSSFVMHDLVNDLAKFVGQEICFSLEENLERNEQRVIFEKFRHSSFTRSYYDVFKKFEAFHGMKEHLRTFMALPTTYVSHISNKVLEELIPKLKCLRVLSLNGYQISEIPDSIGQLKHLNYLNLSHANVKRLPESIGDLYKLQTLILLYCRYLERLPCSIQHLNSLRYLDVTDTALEEMPPQICELKSLQVLSRFIVGTDKDSNVNELRNLSHLRGIFHISKLENVIDVQHARDASLNKKHKLEKLTLSWSDSRNADHQLYILDSLQPHLGLNELRITGYGGPKFAQWLEGVRFSEMVKINLVNCKNCTSLPCLGQLPKLKNLEIERMDEVKNVGTEFHGESGSSFPQLEYLTFSNMPQWERPSSSLSESYPRLFRLSMRYCPKLIKELPTSLPSLVDLNIQECPRLESPLTRFPSLSELSIRGCNEGVVRSGVDIHSLEKLIIYRVAGLIRLHEWFVRLLLGLQVLKIDGCAELRWLWEENGFDGIQQLQTSSCPKEQHGLLSKLRSLEITGCGNLEKLPNGLHRLTCLKELIIKNCPKLSFPNSDFPPMLTRLVIWSEGLTRLPDWIMVARDGSDNQICILEDLEVRNCPRLVCFPEGQLPTTLKGLLISGCETLNSLPGGVMMMQHYHDSTTTGISDGGLHVLEIGACPSLKFFPTGKFPPTLKQLTIWNCPQLESISEKMFHSNDISLELLRIQKYPSLKIIPDCLCNIQGELNIFICENLERLPHQMQNLKKLIISNTQNLEHVPYDQLRNLQQLNIVHCKNVKLVPYQLQGLTALTLLSIQYCESIGMPLSQWGLAMLPSLKQLTICGMFPEITSFSNGPTLPPLLPPTLTSLYIRDFQNLQSLSSLSLQTLTSLERLTICHCPKLESICPKEGLPDMLFELSIEYCPLLKERCTKHKGQDWPNISHIPVLRIK